MMETTMKTTTEATTKSTTAKENNKKMKEKKKKKGKEKKKMKKMKSGEDKEQRRCVDVFRRVLFCAILMAFLVEILRGEASTLHSRLYETHVLKTSHPSPLPTIEPTSAPSFHYPPSASPTPSPTPQPSTLAPTPLPTMSPTSTPIPTHVPSSLPMPSPSPLPTHTTSPTTVPTIKPSSIPTSQPSPRPTLQPSPLPTDLPSSLPTPRGDLAQLRERFATMRPHALKEELAKRAMLKDVHDFSKANLLRTYAMAVHREQWQNEWKLHLLQKRLEVILGELKAESLNLFGENQEATEKRTPAKEQQRVNDAVQALGALRATRSHTLVEERQRAATAAAGALRRLPVTTGEASPARKYERDSVWELVQGIRATLQGLESGLPGRREEEGGGGDLQSFEEDWRGQKQYDPGQQKRRRRRRLTETMSPPAVAATAITTRRKTNERILSGSRTMKTKSQRPTPGVAATATRRTTPMSGAAPPQRCSSRLPRNDAQAESISRAPPPIGMNTTTVLWSFPGSGNTWLRLLLEEVTGGYTSSVFNDSTLVSVLPFEMSDVSAAEACAAFVCVKNHVPWMAISGPLRPKKRRLMTLIERRVHAGQQQQQLNGRTSASTPAHLQSLPTWSFPESVCGGRVERILLLVRSPFRAIWAEFARESTDSHRGTIPLASWTEPKILMPRPGVTKRTSARDEWRAFAVTNGEYWNNQFEQGAGLFADWKETAISSSPLARRGAVIRFEDLASRNRTKRVETLVGAAQFCGFVVTRGEASCALDSRHAMSMRRPAQTLPPRISAGPQKPARQRRREKMPPPILRSSGASRRLGRRRMLIFDQENKERFGVLTAERTPWFVTGEAAWTEDLVGAVWSTVGKNAGAFGYSKENWRASGADVKFH